MSSFKNCSLIMKKIPNILTSFRIILIPIFIYFFLNNQFSLSSKIFVISGLTDLFDGYIARRFNAQSRWGEGYDPLADKLTIIFVVLCLAFKGLLSGFISFFLLLKEILMISLGLYMYNNKIKVKSDWFGKLGTLLFYLIVNYIILNCGMPHNKTIMLQYWLLVIAIIPSITYTLKLIKNLNLKLGIFKKL